LFHTSIQYHYEEEEKMKNETKKISKPRSDIRRNFGSLSNEFPERKINLKLENNNNKETNDNEP